VLEPLRAGRTEALEPRLGRVVELRVFGGLSVGEIASVLKLSEGTVKRDWRRARAMLTVELRGGWSG
jgi:DNA-directed RNA polymerase specialized sigma24 family protein